MGKGGWKRRILIEHNCISCGPRMKMAGRPYGRRPFSMKVKAYQA
jgi:hypothetical protein